MLDDGAGLFDLNRFAIFIRENENSVHIPLSELIETRKSRPLEEIDCLSNSGVVEDDWREDISRLEAREELMECVHICKKYGYGYTS